MLPKLCAFDLDGTLLTSQKTLSERNAAALQEMASMGIIVTFASGRLGSSMRQYAPQLGVDLAMLTLNGAAVYARESDGANLVYDAPLPAEFADFLIEYSKDKSFNLNYYIDDNLYSVRNSTTQPWIDLYHAQTKTAYKFVDSFGEFLTRSPSKIIFVGDEHEMDKQEEHFRKLWGDSVYICRTWEYYLEFLNVKADKGNGITALAKAYNIDLSEVAAFGDANNDIPMLTKAGIGIAMQNAGEEVKLSASRVSEWTNDEDGVAREWEKMKRS